MSLNTLAGPGELALHVGVDVLICLIQLCHQQVYQDNGHDQHENDDHLGRFELFWTGKEWHKHNWNSGGYTDTVSIVGWENNIYNRNFLRFSWVLIHFPQIPLMS